LERVWKRTRFNPATTPVLYPTGVLQDGQVVSESCQGVPELTLDTRQSASSSLRRRAADGLTEALALLLKLLEQTLNSVIGLCKEQVLHLIERFVETLPKAFREK
jgi:hypothetical protein